MNHAIKFTLVAALALGLSACGLFGKKSSNVPESTGSADQGLGTSAYAGEGTPPPAVIGDGGTQGSGGFGADGAGGAGNVVYFEFDSIEISESGRSVVAAAGQYLSSRPAAKVRLDGHADERGTREYNVGLGERRANAVMQALVAAGASAGQISVTSYGEERPAASGHDESSWALNRRVEIVR